MKSRKLRFYHGFLAVLIASMTWYSCTKADLTFGDQWLDNDYTKVSVLDTVTPRLSTVYLDSFSTNSSGYALMGVYKDPYLGTVSASTYVRLQPPSGVTNGIRDSLQYATFDSAVVYLKLKRNEYGDTLKNLTLNVYQLAQNIYYGDNTTNLYNNTTFRTNSSPVGSRTFSFNPNIDQPNFGDTLLVRLNDQLGNNLFNLLKNYSPYIQNSTDFLSYMPGLKITGEATGDDGFVMNASDSIFIRVYYDVAGFGETVRKYYDYSINDAAYQFNNISIDRSNTLLSKAGIGSTNKTISSLLTDSMAFLQQTTRTAVKVTFPSVQSVRNASNFLQLARAVLVVRPITNSILPYYPAPSPLYIATTDYTNKYTESSGTSATPVLDPSTRTYYYTYDITTYIKGTELVYDDLTGRGLMLYLPASTYKSRINRLVLGDANRVFEQQGVQLYLYYISVK